MSDHIQIFVKTIAGQTRVLLVPLNETVANVKQLISEKEGGIPLKMFYLLAMSKNLDESKLLSDYGIEDMYTIYIMFRSC